MSAIITPTVPDERYILTNHASVSVTPYQGFDTTITTLRFGEAVTVKAYQGEYAQILTAHGLGWVAKDYLEPDRAKIWPNLVAGTTYASDSVVTHLIRRHQRDAFNAGAMQLPLQSVEYVTYRLRQVGRTINWGSNRPRLPGMWHEQLKGRSGIHMSVRPLCDSVMEYRTGPKTGVLMYIEAVAPDNSLTCSTVGLAEVGEYMSYVYTETTWREWQPVFIDVVA